MNKKTTLTTIASLITLAILASTQITTAQTIIKNIKGVGDLTPPYFTVPTSDWIIEWDYKTSSPDYALFAVFVYPRGETGIYIDSFRAEGESKNGTRYILEGNGDYYLKIFTANLNRYEINIIQGQNNNPTATPTPTPSPIFTSEPTQSTINFLTPTPTPRNYPGWETLYQINGAASQTTQTYYISSNQWRITWTYTPHETMPEYSAFSFFVYPQDTTTQYTNMVNVMGYNQLTGTEYIHEGSGGYYLKILTANIPEYSILIQEKTSQNTTPQLTNPPNQPNSSLLIGALIVAASIFLIIMSVYFIIVRKSQKKEGTD